MQKTTFTAQTYLLRQKWPWPAASTEARDEYEATLWARVCDWRGPKAEAFKRAIGDLVAASQYGRPTVDQIIARSMRYGGGDSDDVRQEQSRASVEAMWKHYARPGKTTTGGLMCQAPNTGNPALDNAITARAQYERGHGSKPEGVGEPATAEDWAQARASFAHAASNLRRRADEIKGDDEPEDERRRRILSAIEDYGRSKQSPNR